MPHTPSAATRRHPPARWIASAAIAMALVAAPGWAAKVYRCGNAFQDLPCPEPKAPEQRPAERPAAVRDATPCGPSKDAGGRSDCIGRSSTRDAQTAAVVEAKR